MGWKSFNEFIQFEFAAGGCAFPRVLEPAASYSVFPRDDGPDESGLRIGKLLWPLGAVFSAAVGFLQLEIAADAGGGGIVVCNASGECPDDADGSISTAHVSSCSRVGFLWSGRGVAERGKRCSIGLRGDACCVCSLLFRFGLSLRQGILAGFAWTGKQGGISRTDGAGLRGRDVRKFGAGSPARKSSRFLSSPLLFESSLREWRPRLIVDGKPGPASQPAVAAYASQGTGHSLGGEIIRVSGYADNYCRRM